MARMKGLTPSPPMRKEQGIGTALVKKRKAAPPVPLKTGFPVKKTVAPKGSFPVKKTIKPVTGKAATAHGYAKSRVNFGAGAVDKSRANAKKATANGGYGSIGNPVALAKSLPKGGAVAQIQRAGRNVAKGIPAGVGNPGRIANGAVKLVKDAFGHFVPQDVFMNQNSKAIDRAVSGKH